MYEYFPNKESVLQAFLKYRIDSLLAFISESVKHSQEKSSMQRNSLKNLIKITLDVCLLKQYLLRVLVNEVPGVSNLLSVEDIENKILLVAKFLAE